MMTATEFNEKYNEYLEEGHYGLDIDNISVIAYLDKIFEGLIKIPGFQYSQIKMKWDSCRFYSTLSQILPEIGSKIDREIERDITLCLKY